ncbi:MAG: hypothetical protein GX591_19960, partial [Planctomycetes bacterium]|nr:hypothetical protein [Planctomycetota bacterium]
VWTHTVDAEHLDALWYSVLAQAATPEDSSVELRVRASNDRAALDYLPYVQVTSDQILQDITGRYLQVQVTLRSTSWDVTPALKELVIECASAAPRIRVDAPADGSRIAAGATALISGLASAGHPTVPLAAVMIDGSPVDALDAAGAFFTQVIVAPGQNTFELTAIDVAGKSATTSLTLVGIPGDPSHQPWTSMTDLAQFSTDYHRTSFHERENVLYVDLELTNTGPYAVDGPLYLGITNISHPGVFAAGADGVSSEGIPYFDFSRLVGEDGVFSPQETISDRLTLSFFNPYRVPFTYDLVLVGATNQPPQFSSVPRVSAPQDLEYQYLAEAVDPDGDAVSYRLTAAPSGMEIEEQTGLITWSRGAQSLPPGNYSVAVEAADGFGGAARQSFTLTVYAPPENQPPVFRSIPAVAAYVSAGYAYDADAFDPDGDTLVYRLTESPAGMSIDPATGVIQWTPTAEQVGVHAVSLRVSDGPLEAEQTFAVRAFAAPGNHAPTIVSHPVRAVLAGTEYRYQVAAVDPDRGDAVAYVLLEPIPNGMSIDAQTGLITWSSPVDNTVIGVRAADGRGGRDDQEFTLTVTSAAPRSITGTVYYDANENGSQDGGEGGLEGRVVYLDRNGNRRRDADEAWAATDADGEYSLDHLVSGNHTVALEHAGGWVQQTPGGARIVTIADQDIAGADFGLVPNTASNRAPHFISAPPTAAAVGIALGYTALAEDLDQDPLEYTLAYGPEGMAVERLSGKVVWTPAATQTGVVYAGVRVSDGRGGVELQPLSLVVDGGAATAPVFDTEPVRVARLSASYAYDADAHDPINPTETLVYWLDQASLFRGMTIDSGTGQIAWAADEMALGVYDVTVWVADEDGQTAYQWYRLQVTSQSDNRPPVVGADVVMTIPAEVAWYDRVPASDPDGEPLGFTLVNPGGIAGLAMLSSPYDSWVSWTPTLAQVNDPDAPYEFSVEVSDGEGHALRRSYRIHVTADLPQNRAPAIVSSPRQAALAAEVYAYQAVAEDPEGHAVRWQLEERPEGMTIDAETGLVLWAPTTADLGSHAITVLAVDVFGATARQPYPLTVSAINRPPYFTTPPRTWAAAGKPYAYHAGAEDPDRQALRFELAPGLAGASIHPQTGLLTWTPPAEGSYPMSVPMSVRVVDTLGLEAVQNFSVHVAPLPPNRPPFFRNAPEPVALVGKEYAWLVDAVDPDHKQSELTFAASLEAFDPADAELVALYADGLDGDDLAFADGQANLLRWDAVPAGLAGKAIWVTVTVSDPVPAPDAGVAQKRCLLTLRENNRPTVWLQDQAITAGQDFACDVAAEDLDPADVLSFSLSGAAGSTLPAGMTIDPQLGRIRWNDALEGSYELIVSVSDGVDTTSGSFRLDVLPDDRPPVVELSLSHRVADVGQRVRIWVIDSDDVGVTGRTLSIDGQPVALDGAGAAEFTVEGQFGHVFALEATARDAAGNVSLPATATLLIRNPDNRAPQVALTSPAA